VLAEARGVAAKRLWITLEKDESSDILPRDVTLKTIHREPAVRLPMTPVRTVA
jgi:hypothetical protein